MRIHACHTTCMEVREQQPDRPYGSGDQTLSSHQAWGQELFTH